MKKIALVLGIILISNINSFGQASTIKVSAENKDKEIQIQLKKSRDLTVIIDGKKYDEDILDIIDPSKIEKINVLKGENAMEKYNCKSAIEITTKGEIARIAIRSSGTKDLNESGNPIVIVDGVVKDKNYMESISPDDIISVSVLKDDETKKKYNTDLGVILIKTKNKR